MKECYDCKSLFGTFLRRHHCRVCGQIFCFRCASHTVPVERSGQNEVLRVCDFCLNVMDGYCLDEAAEEEEDAKIEALDMEVLNSINKTPFRNNNLIDSKGEEEYPKYTDSFQVDTRSFSFDRMEPTPKSFVKPDATKKASINQRRKFSARLVRYPSTRVEDLGAQSNSENVEINAASINHVRLLMDQMFSRSKVDQAPEWKKVILVMLLKVCKRLDPNVRNEDELDIRRYIKIKKIPGGKIDESHYVDGIVATKNVIHKQMLKGVSNARVLLITFALEYQRIENQFISLEPVIAQEREHIRNLCGRLIALRPDVIMVEKTVCRIALDFLLQENIIVIQSVKIGLLEKISRCTKADVIHSIDQLKNQSIGTCERFCFKSYGSNDIEGFRKTFLYVEGTPETLCCTIVLRGAALDILKKIKKIVDFLVFIIYNLKLETCLLQDEYALTPGVECESLILSGSPNVHFPINVTELEMTPVNYQSIVVLYSKNSDIPCSKPQPFLIEYYQDSDLTLGHFIEDAISSANQPCVLKGCGVSMMKHFRTYTHGNGQVVVRVDSLNCPVQGMEDRILMWSLCRICKESTPFISMSENSWKYSFGKYLELTFYHTKLGCRPPNDCKHDVLREHTRYFSFRNLAVSFTYTEIDLYEVAGPPMHRVPKSSTIARLKMLDFDLLRKQINDFYNSLESRILNFTYDILSPNKIPLCREIMLDLSSKAVLERKSLITQLYQIMHLTSPTESYSLHGVLKGLQSNVLKWDSEFHQFIRNHLQTDARDLRRITTDQFKRIFTDTIQTNDLVVRSAEEDYSPDFIRVPEALKTASPTLAVVEDEDFYYSTQRPQAIHFNDDDDARPTSIMKTITNLWNGHTANFLPLVYPSSQNNHFFTESEVIVREDELSSVVAFTLLSKHYLSKLNGTASQEECSYKYSIDFEAVTSEVMTDLEVKVVDRGTNINYEFWDSNTKMNCKVFFAERFDRLRRDCGIEELFEQSLARSIRWDATGGKSGTFFMKTRDDWLVIKKLSLVELEALVSFCPKYFEYMAAAASRKLPTVLAKIYGIYHVGIKNPNTRKTVKMDILVMENLFYDRSNFSHKFDLKGSVRNRHVQSTGKENEVLLDKNLLEFLIESPLFIRDHSKKALRAAVSNDTYFLSTLNVMDYSMLVGIDRDSKELVVGIVDFMRTFTWDKKLESWVKETGLLGGGKDPTITTPIQYRNRFSEAMEKYFLLSPSVLPKS